MVKSKRLSRGSLAVLLLALLLALSMVVGITGAWFTDSENGSGDTLNFGTINLAKVTDSYRATRTLEGSDNTADLMPGDTLAVSFNVAKNAETDEDMYYAFKLTVTGDAKAVVDAPATLTGYTFDNGIWYSDAAITDATPVAVSVNYTIANSVGNTPEGTGTYQGKAVTFALQVVAIQAANMNAATAKTELAKLFA